jgi:F-type H+-transporting ATPase subunit delta
MPQISSSARHYAAAVFEVARESNSLDEWLTDLERVAQVLAVPQAERALTSPAVPEGERLAALKRLVPDLGPPAQSLLTILVQRGRLQLVPQILADYGRRLDEHRGVAIVEVTTAVALDGDSERVLAERLSRYTGRQVRLEKQVDPEIIGGVVARIGDELIDDSVRGRLDRLHRRLAGGLTITG